MKNKIKEVDIRVVIIIAALIVGMFYLQAQKNKSESIEKQQALKLEAEMVEREEKKCSAMTTSLQKQYNNIISVNYSNFWEECEVTYINPETDAMDSAPLSTMTTHEK